MEEKQKQTLMKILARKVTREDFEKFDIDGDGRIERTEFVIRKLMIMGLVNATDIERVEQEFDVMDSDGSGEITLDDLFSEEREGGGRDRERDRNECWKDGRKVVEGGEGGTVEEGAVK